MRRFGVAGLQLELAGKDNIEVVGREVLDVKRRFPWIDMVVAGELSAFGPGVDLAQERGGDAECRFCEIARAASIWLIPGTIYERLDDQVFNTAPVIDPDGNVVARYQKMFPFLPHEIGVTPGADFIVFDIPGIGRCGVSICYDGWFPETTRTLASMGAEIILHPTMTNTIDRDVELSIARTNAAINQCYFVDINVSGDYGVGKSIVCGPGGEVIYQAGDGRDIIALDLNLDDVTACRERGWHGLGQPLKSFRDSNIVFPPYEKGANKTDYLQQLGALKKHRSNNRNG